MPTKNVISETVVSLSADIDNAGIQKLLGLLDQNRLKAYTLAAALAAATTGVYKFMQSVTKQEFELEKLSKQQSKSIEQTRAEQKALEAMGVTLNDISLFAASAVGSMVLSAGGQWPVIVMSTWKPPGTFAAAVRTFLSSLIQFSVPQP